VPEFRRLAELFTKLGNDLAASPDVTTALRVIADTAVRAVDGAEHAAVTTVTQGELETVAHTSDLPLAVDAIQYDLHSGPCVDAIVAQTVFRCDDLRTDLRWPEFGHRAAAETGVLSMLSFRMFFEDSNLIVGLNLYSKKPAAFTDESETTGLILATHGALALSNVERRQHVSHLERALSSNRDIGMAMGILMARHLLTKEQAFDLLRVASQHTHRKLAQIALDVIDTGSLDFPGPRPSPSA
jgi:GAF domain-containing protein